MKTQRWMVVGVVLAIAGAAAIALSTGMFRTPDETAQLLPQTAAPDNETAFSETPEVPETTSEEPSVPAVAETPVASSPSSARAAGDGRIFGEITLPANAPRGLEISVALHRLVMEEPNTTSISPEAKTTAAANGAYEFGNLEKGTYEVVATATGYADVRSAELLPRGSMEEKIDLQLRPVGTVSGRVVNADGAPVQGAAVAMVNAEVYSEHTHLADETVSARQITPADGTFTISTMPVTSNRILRYELMASAAGYAPTKTEYIRVGTTNAEIVLKPGTTVSGVLVDDATGTPLADKTVMLVTDIPMMMMPAATDADGFFFLANVPPGEQRARLVDKELVLLPESASFTVAEGAPTDEVTLRAAVGGRITGRVYDKDTGAGIAGIQVHADQWGDDNAESHQSETGANGTYAIGGLSSKAYRVFYEKPDGYATEGFQNHWNRQIAAGIGREITGIDFAMSKGIQIRGRVEDEDGNSIAGASVNAYSTRSGTSDFSHTKSDGTFTLAGFGPNETLTIDGSKENYAVVRTEPKNGRITIAEENINDVRIVLGPASSIAGLVVDAQGRPKAGIEMTASGTADDDNHAWATSAADGSIVFEDLTAGEYEVSFNSEAVSFNSSKDSKKIRVGKSEHLTGQRFVAPDMGQFAIAGRVEDSRGRPIVDADISLMGNGFDFRNTETDDQGTFRIDGIKEGRYQVEVGHDDYSDASALPATAGTMDLRVVLKDLATMEGQVLSAVTGQPVTAFTISAGKEDAGRFGFFMPEMNADAIAVHDPEGRFSLTNVEDGTTTITVNAEGFAEINAPIPTMVAGETRRDVIVRLTAGATLAGRVTDSAGKPVAGAKINLGDGVEMWEALNSSLGTTSGDGSFRITSLTPGPIELSVSHAKYPTTIARTTVAAGAEGRLDIVMAKGGTVEGRVTLNGRPIADQEVNVGSVSSFGMDEEHVTDSAGKYRIAGVASGTAIVIASVEVDGVSRSRMQDAEVKDGMVTQLDFNFVSGSSAIEGTIFEEQGVPLSESIDLTVSMDSALGENFSASSDENGRYAFEGLPPGRASLGVEMEGTYKGLTVEVPENKRVQQDIFLFGGATIRVKLIGVEPGAMMTPVMLFVGSIDTSQMTMESLETDVQPAGMALATGDEAILEGIEPGTYTVAAVVIDMAELTAGGENAFSPSNFITKVIEVKKDEELVIELDLKP